MESQPPRNCTVLVVGGGPAGSYCASVLAREGIDTVVLEAEKFPRYHVGESMLPSIRHFMRFIDCDEKFDAHGFRIKKGATFKLNSKEPGSTDFVAAGGPQGYAYNVVRSESDELLFRHAGESGAHIYDGFKVKTVDFVPSGLPRSTDPECEIPDPGRAKSATWTRSKDGASGVVNFDYLVDASGRQGLMSTKYLKNRQMNNGEQLQSIANWGYWTNGGTFGIGTAQEGNPYFESLHDGSGWAWYIPLHNGQCSVGVVRNQKVLAQKKRDSGLDSKAIYLDTLKYNAGMRDLLAAATLVSDVKSASDWSYNAPAYASPYVRIAGDAGCFVDPFFSSGVHLALNAGLSAATTICASIKGQVSELAAATWHSKKVAASYTRFLIVVSSALKQILEGEEPVISDYDEKSFERAFQHFRPSKLCMRFFPIQKLVLIRVSCPIVIQGSVDVSANLSQAEVMRTLNFCMGALASNEVPEKEALLQKLRLLAVSDSGTISDEKYMLAMKEAETILTAEQLDYLNSIRKNETLIPDDIISLDSTGFDVLDGFSANLIRGHLGLVEPRIPSVVAF
ncbi:Flavine halogenase [Lachnellula subtilissima]|uniref:Flavine halogenase n=1 Tax=Lachnellula subtilissima TaxID=602034 RepID=A0A8H8S0T0_9HELO|nr:Flavine halogenase [Lachnellula subtilissima]